MRMYGVYLAEENGVGFRLPINPEHINIEQDADHQTETVIKVGEVVLPRLPKLRRIKFGSFWPRVWYPFSTSAQFFEPKWYIEKIQAWRQDKKILQFIIDGPTQENISVIIERFAVSENVGYEGEPKYEIALIEYRYIAPKKVQIKTQTTKSASQPPPKRPTTQKPKTYTLKPGDSLWAVAQKIYGDGRKYTDIQKANNIKDADLRRLPVGKVLVIP